MTRNARTAVCHRAQVSITLRAALFLVALIATAGGAVGNVTPLTDADWSGTSWPTDGSAQLTVSQQGRHLEVQLLRRTGFNNPRYAVRILLGYNDFVKGDSIGTIVISKDPSFLKPDGIAGSGRGRHVDLTIAGSQLASLAQTKNVNVDLIDPRGGNQSLSLTVRPYEGPNLLDTLKFVPSSGSVLPGDLITFRPILQDVAAAGGVQISWTLVTSSCFEAAKGGVPYQPSGALNVVTIPTGDQTTSFAVRASTKLECQGSHNIETWVGNTNTRQAPIFRSFSFRITTPPRR